jgi:hypothetical protein
MSLASPGVETLPAVKAELNYLAPMSERPRTYTYDPPPGVPRTTVVNDTRAVVIRDARRILRDVALDDVGFGLLLHRSGVRNFYDDAEVKRVYYPEAEDVLKGATGADRVFIFDHTVRRRIPGAEDRGRDLPRQPVPRVHVDHTETSGPQRVHDLLPNEAEDLLRGRVQIINLWRPIRGPRLAIRTCPSRLPGQGPAQSRPLPSLCRGRIHQSAVQAPPKRTDQGERSVAPTVPDLCPHPDSYFVLGQCGGHRGQGVLIHAAIIA